MSYSYAAYASGFCVVLNLNHHDHLLEIAVMMERVLLPLEAPLKFVIQSHLMLHLFCEEDQVLGEQQQPVLLVLVLVLVRLLVFVLVILLIASAWLQHIPDLNAVVLVVIFVVVQVLLVRFVLKEGSHLLDLSDYNKQLLLGLRDF